MRRIGVLIVALGYGACFVAVCLAACLAGPADADHGCCPGEDGIRAADRECCAVTPGESQGGAQVADARPTYPSEAAFTFAVRPPVPPATPVALPTSPPLVLRV